VKAPLAYLLDYRIGSFTDDEWLAEAISAT
jgi:hypothetical protein